MSVRLAFHDLLAAQPAVTALVGNRIYPLLLPRTGRVYPAITYQAISDPPAAEAEGGTLEAREARVQVNCWATTYAAADAVADAVVSGLRLNSDRSAATPILNAYDVTRLDDHDPDAGDPETGLYRQIVDMMVLYIGN